ncbi:MAG: penicillin-binding protein activator [Deltaproteobacteria bacterium]|nr:penicillin-binding protein activator [Deltaproteobacteria bacterium]
MHGFAVLKKIGLPLLSAFMVLVATIPSTMAAPKETTPLMIHRPEQVNPANAVDPVRKDTVDRYALGVVLPLTGPHSQEGERALEALMLGTGVFEGSRKTPVRIFIEDTQSRPESAKAAVQALVREEKVVGILGPLQEDEAMEAAGEAQRLKVPIVTLAKKEDITSIGDYVFRYSMTNPMQMQTLVKYAMVNRGFRHFVVLYPRDRYGEEMQKLFQEEVRRRDGTIRNIQSYDKAKMDFSHEIRALVGLPALNGEGEPVAEQAETTRPADSAFDGLFLPDSQERLDQITAQLFFHGVEGVRLLGTSCWNSAGLLGQAGDYLEGAVFVDAFFLDSVNREVNDFIDIFYTAFARDPDSADALLYDASSAAAKLIWQGQTETRDQFRYALTKLKNYPGIAGMASIGENRNAQIELLILGIRDGRIVQLH